jgi:hypothetical protein
MEVALLTAAEQSILALATCQADLIVAGTGTLCLKLINGESNSTCCYIAGGSPCFLAGTCSGSFPLMGPV